MPSLVSAGACAFPNASANAPLSPLARLRHCDAAGASARNLVASGGSPRAGRTGAPGGPSRHRSAGGMPARAAGRLGGASDECFSVEWAEQDGSWRERFRTRAKDACGDTSAACYVRQKQAAAVGVDACAACEVKCCSWASAQVQWHLSGADADSLDETEARFRAALQANPGNAAALAAYAVFMHDERRNEAEASAMFETAATLAPQDLDVLASWAYHAMTAGR